MDMMSVVSSLLAMQMGNTQQQIGISALKSSLNSESSVLQLLDPSANAPAANNAPGIGGNLDISA